MIINIDLEDWQCDNLLKIHKYITEKVTAYYRVNSNPYGEDNGIQDLRPVKIKIAYPIDEKPEELKKEHPMLDALKEYTYDEVVTRLCNRHLWKAIISG